MLGSKHHQPLQRIGRPLCAVALALVGCLAARAQYFTEHLTAQGGAGSGTVTLTQDQRLTNLIDHGVPGTHTNSTGTVNETDNSNNDNAPAATPAPKKKMRGFRIQMYWGNAQRSDQEKADQMGARVTALYPELEAYTDFSSPHWRCRVGDFTSRDEAAEYLPKLRRLSSDAMIVISEIYVDQ